MPGGRSFSRKRLKEIILYVAEKSQGDERFGATKLNKILYYSDFMAYGLFGKSLTGALYQRIPRGPAPKALVPVRDELVQAGDAHIEERAWFNRTQKRLIALRSADLTRFRAEEIKLVDQIIYYFRSANASQVSELSHVEMGWKLAEDKETIPYETAFLSNEPLAHEEIKRFQELAADHGWT